MIAALANLSLALLLNGGESGGAEFRLKLEGAEASYGQVEGRSMVEADLTN
ncbi:hypothetical protein MF271_22140 (plasmid) [Deinococcus sp. KNUC1210]|uniref:hypothetical protein n=1 Tax=Deinococcus sp. KNUC1210 TaxID=2917691 RepID=UPI001EF01262|nr:hypothetical protein [Deinococcus sp. KNUC1210]ULH18177.1 hypothetical protein MF271_22140 [Deinococcus sp. KNUC1210]